ncbi:hypothetical protein [Sorangium sp. So ce381]|uniref:hypothetical protein n=1 Tax=Sorangium sp. So ce381 TaxID=3133307 RepID=UPI003F5BBE57
MFDALLSLNFDEPASLATFVGMFMVGPGAPWDPEIIERVRAAAFVARTLRTAVYRGYEADWVHVVELANELARAKLGVMKRRALVAKTVQSFAERSHSEAPSELDPVADRESQLARFIESLQACDEAFGRLSKHPDFVEEIIRAMSPGYPKRFAECRAAAELSIRVSAFGDHAPVDKVQATFEAAYSKGKREQEERWSHFRETMRSSVRQEPPAPGSDDRDP